MRSVLFLLLLLLSGCGYHFPGQGGSLPGSVSKLFVPLFINQTAEPRLENDLTNRVSERLARHKQVTMVERGEDADARLQGIIAHYSNRAVAYDSNDDISEYRATMVLNVKLLSLADAEVLWQNSLTWQVEYAAADDKALQQDLEQSAIEELNKRLADELLFRLLDDF
jgi:outer membrane lipopolysaccharide assembly protein LptE/RlpB